MGPFDSSGSPYVTGRKPITLIATGKPVGIVAFSFGLTKKEPNPCNITLAKEVQRIARLMQGQGREVVVVAQWEVATAIPPSMMPAHIVTKHRRPDSYLDSDEVMAQAAEVFRKQGITEVIPVANPFLHFWKCRQLVRQSGFSLLQKKISQIGFCQESIQWWEHGPLQLLLYAVLQKLFGRRGR